MLTETIRLRNWGNYPEIQAELSTAATEQEAMAYVQSKQHLIARGNGKCYGDAALSEHVLSTLQLNQILDFNAETGLVHCEAGVLLSHILQIAVPLGWFFHVTPGIKNITVGGAIASDVHGKNHPEKGCFSNWLHSFDLLTADGGLVHCSKTEHADLFWQTCGGMGWTGVILRARFQLMRIQSTEMRQMAVRAGNLEALFKAYETHRDWPYAAGWVDCLSTGESMGRGVVYFARHHAANSGEPLQWVEKKAQNVPFYLPSWTLNRLSIGMHNHMLFSKAKTEEALVSMDRYFYPLDAIRNWNRLYGRRGFIQYQFCVPEANAFDGIRKVLECIHQSDQKPFLTVLKRHGARPSEAIHSFPIEGYSLALDFPRKPGILQLVALLDEIVWTAGGKIYLTKDACSAQRMGRIDPGSFGSEKFSSVLKERISL